MSYKNHALDEFLMDLMALPGMEDKVVRVGGRCSNAELEKVSLNILRKDKVKHPKSKALNHEFYSVYEDAGQRQAQLKARLNHVSRLLSEPGVLVQEAATRAQLRTLLVNWRPSVLHQQKLRQEAIAEWKNLRKPIEDPEALAAWLDIPLVRQAVHTAVACWLPNKEERRQHAATAAASSNSAGAESVESHIARVLANFEQRFGQVLSGKAKSNKQQQQKQQQQQPTDDPVDDEDSEAAEFAMQQRQSAFMFQLGKKRTTDVVVKFGQQDGLTAGGLMLEASSQTGRLAALRSDLWRLDIGERCDLLHYWLQEKVTGSMAQVETQLADYLQVSETRRRLQRRHCAEIVKSKRIVGMTITGASINKDLLTAVKPAVILVEEAAEVGEPQLLSCLTDSTQHLILIGDHKQLRPQTESYELRIKYHLDVSMFERLINNGIAYDQLELQNRMRPEFSRLLKDIYPNLRDNLAVVSKHEQILCLEKSMYFWTHSCPEISDRSYTNDEEAQRAVQLACFLATVGGVEPAKITIIAMYRGQTALIRRYLKKRMMLLGILPPAGPSAASAAGPELPISVHTVDLYQGDENDVIIVSLVRSNRGSRLGFLKDLSRRCVAQSRARRGMYILGNADCLAGCQEHQLWRRLIQSMTEVGCLGPRLALVCPRHRDATPAPRREVTDANEGFPTSLDFCDRLCDAFMDCGQHKCQKLCRSPRHSHKNCEVMVDFLYNGCSHPGQRKCNEDPADLLCQARVSVSCPKCQQSDTKPCHQPMSDYSCPQPCPKRLSCGHACPEKCGDPCPANPAKDCRTCLEAERLRKEALKRQDEEMQNLARREAKDEYERIKPDKEEEMSLIKLDPGSSEFFDIQDRVTKYVQMTHGWFPKVRSVERLRNVKLRMRFLSYRQNTAKDATRVELKFHGTSADGVKGITKEGFHLPQNPGMFGAGIYFASDASKSAQELYTKGSRTLLLCEVLLGRSLRVTEATNSKYNWKSLRQENYDSIFAPRDTKNSGGVLFDEFVVFNPDQAYPKYIIKYESVSGEAALNEISKLSMGQTQPKTGNTVVKIPASVVATKPETSPEVLHYSIANSHFLSSFQGGQMRYKVTEVWHNSNPRLEHKFAAKQAEFKAKYGPDHQYAQYVLAFHGTKTAAIVDDIMANNFDLKKLQRCAHGFGVYLSEFADVSVGYGTEMLLCRVLPGNPQEGCGGSRRIDPGYNSIRVNKSTDGRGWALVIDNVDQILPLYKVVFQ
ncbi:hypothetical protein BOX15_Mlig026662g3 [Macrostomum lignano]|uniref:Poly [ADP-ribose] polymerase n=2 Tax=Macrostomum lignano TaxID=282301 RepID=A0A267DG06_9PLAT|nr:hypothetical protein BOX15_Mlig026662g3 [Macrostomum lignano]